MLLNPKLVAHVSTSTFGCYVFYYKFILNLLHVHKHVFFSELTLNKLICMNFIFEGQKFDYIKKYKREK